MADPNALPPALQGALAIGLAIGGVISPIVAIFAAKPKPETDASKAVSAAVIAPMGDANQLRQVVEAVNRLGDFAEQSLARLDDVKGLLTDLKDGQKLQREALRDLKPPPPKA